MNITIMRQVHFSAGHRLVGHEGKCVNLHGHNYTAQFFVTGREIDECGRVVDFSVINRLFKGWIDEHWDHGMLIWDKDAEAINAIQQMASHRLYRLPFNPTAENIVRYLLTQIAPRLMAQIAGYDVHVSKVIVWETENSYAEVSISGLSNEAASHTQTASAELNNGQAPARADKPIESPDRIGF